MVWAKIALAQLLSFIFLKNERGWVYLEQHTIQRGAATMEKL